MWQRHSNSIKTIVAMTLIHTSNQGYILYFFICILWDFVNRSWRSRRPDKHPPGSPSRALMGNQHSGSGWHFPPADQPLCEVMFRPVITPWPLASHGLKQLKQQPGKWHSTEKKQSGEKSYCEKKKKRNQEEKTPAASINKRSERLTKML